MRLIVLVKIGFSCKSPSAMLAKIFGWRPSSQLTRFKDGWCCDFGPESHGGLEAAGINCGCREGCFKMVFMIFFRREWWFAGNGRCDEWK